MGVNGLWTVLQPCARPTNLSTLNRKRLAIDASIWIYQFLKAVRDKEGNALRNSHVVGFFRRICKLLWYGIKPVFVFDGGAPALKRATIQARRRRREGRRDDATRTAGKLLAVQMHRMAEEEEERRRKRAEAREGKKTAAAAVAEEEEQEQLPDMSTVVYADELGMSQPDRLKTRRFHKQDAYHLPDLDGSIEGMGKPDDPRIMSVEELEEYARQFENGEDINLYDFSKIDFDGEFFKSLPPADRYNILNAARLRSRLRMGLSKEQLDVMFPNRMDFSRFQIERVKERNHLTQRLMYEMGMTGLDLTLAVNATRVAGDQNREYILVKNEGAEGGYALGVVSKEKDKGQVTNPIDVDELEFQFQGMGEDEDEEDDDDVEFEDVPIEGLNRLPKLTSRAAPRKDKGYGETRRPFYGSRKTEEMEEEEDDEALFVDNGQDAMFEEEVAEADEEEDLNRAIEMSLRNQHGVGVRPEKDEDEDMEFEEVTPPEWTQKAVEAPKPIVSTSGRMVAHIVNNRANAAVPKRRESTDSSDSEGDIRAAMAAARKKQAKAPPPKPVVENRPAPANAPFKGPLPFEKLDWKQLLGGGRPNAQPQEKKVSEPPRPVETGEMEPSSDDEAGGFERETEEDAQNKKDAPKPLPPWLANNDEDIRETVRKQREHDRKMAEEDEDLAREEQARIRKQRQDDIMLIESSDESDDDVEILDAPPPKKPTQTPGASLPSLDDASQEQPTDEPEASRRSPTPNEEGDDITFEDVTLPSQTMTLTFGPPATQSDEDAQIEADLFKDVLPPPAQQERIEGLAPNPDDTAPSMDVVDPDAPALSEFEDDFSDPEEQELLASLAAEAEAHARFATELNPHSSTKKTLQENAAAYEAELKSLRTQQRKDRRDADEVTSIMVTECQALLRYFGIPYITAPMEAEAQCAELVRLGLVDGIVTDDSDTFLFGGNRVYKNMFNGNKFVECYLSSDIERELSLGRDQLIALAQLLGSDYTEGLQGVGPVTAVEVLSEFSAALDGDGDGEGEGGISSLKKFKEWWHTIQSSPTPDPELLATPFRRKFRKSHATKLFLPLGFPNPAVFEAYLHPEVDSTPEPFQWGVPDLEGLRQFLMSTIGWSPERTDEVLVPVIRDVNRREREGTQSNITRFFEGSTGTGTVRALGGGGQGGGNGGEEGFAPRESNNKGRGSKRMAEAVGRLKARGRGGGSGLSTALPVMAMGPPLMGDGEEGEGGKKKRKRGTGKGSGRGKGKGKAAAETEAEVEEDGDEEQVEEEDGDNEDVVASNSRGKRGSTRGRGRGKRAKA
ncbi:putative Rad2 protein [Sordaria brevicollis]|uniref:Rad2 protein n=1 Tax=Sordaria brevicollis TaxID=83679 RepID=A0AAE0PAU2_SORBR|nr:putative Rad2 protein [Sordaria brevicollis]